MGQIKIIFLVMILTALSICCKKNSLNVEPIGAVDENTIANQKGVEGLLIGAYSLLDGFALDIGGAANWGGSGSNWIYGGICGSEAYKGSTLDDQFDEITSLETFRATEQNPMLAQKWKTVYAGVARANQVLSVMKKAKDIQPEDRIRITAEARFLRGFYHFEAIKVFNKVPYVDETINYNDGNYFLSNDTLIWPAIENDFTYAMQNLRPIMNGVGRANKYAAEAYLAKAYMFEKKFPEAKTLLIDLIDNGMTASGTKYALLDKFSDNFDPATQNSSESVFAAQTSVNDGSGGYNGNIGDILNFPAGSNSPGKCCGFYQPSQYLVNHFKTDSVTGLPDLFTFNDVDIRNDQFLSPDSSFTPDTQTLDPRLDLTVGRRGIPFLDWGNHPGTSSDWIREPVTFGPYDNKKNVYSKLQQSSFTDAGFWSTGSVATKINLLRFSDILLWAAEVESLIGSLDEAQKWVNEVRNRMHDHHQGWVHKYLDDNNPQNGAYSDDAHLAANYKINPYPDGYFSSHGRDYAIKAVRYERMLELGMEGHRFFDLVRWEIAETEINKYFENEKKNHSYLNGAAFTKNKNEYFPIPQTQIDLSVDGHGVQHLKQNPGY